jgi:hypothetical protein
MTDIVDDSIRGVEEAEGTGSECASGHVWLFGRVKISAQLRLNGCRSPLTQPIVALNSPSRQLRVCGMPIDDSEHEFGGLRGMKIFSLSK